MSMIDKKLHFTPVNWLHKFVHLFKLDNYVYYADKSESDFSGAASNELLLQLCSSATWSIGNSIDLVEDILGWINDNIDDLTIKKTSEINIIQGDALSEFITDKQQKGKCKEISPFVLNTLVNSVVVVAVDEYGNITYDMMIRSNRGLSEQSLEKFSGQPILKIKIST